MASVRKRAGSVLVLLPLIAGGCSLNPSLRLAGVAPTAAPIELQQVPFHAQQAHHCGPASLLSLLEAAGADTDYQAVVDRVYVPGLEGSLQVEMLAAARSFGYIAYTPPPEVGAVLAEVDAGRPVLVLLNLGVPKKPVWHYALVIGYDPRRNELILHSGDTARVRHKASAWLRRWNWAGRWSMVLLAPGEWPATADRERMLRALSAFEESAQPAATEDAWRAAVERWPEEPIAWLGLGNAQQRQSWGENARMSFRRALAIDPDHLPARLNLAYSLAEDGRSCEAGRVLGTAPPADHALNSTFSEIQARLDRECDGGRSSQPGL